MGGVARMLLTGVLVGLIAASLAACGGGGSDDSEPDSTATQPAGNRENPEGSPNKGSESAGAGSATREGPKSFRRPGADNSIQEYGQEASDADLEAASEVALAFMRARARGDWAKTCTHMASSAVKPLERLAKDSPDFEGKGCADVLEAFLGSTPAADRAGTIAGGIGSLRVEGGEAFALYHGADGRDYFLPLAEENGEWKVDALAESPLPGS